MADIGAEAAHLLIARLERLDRDEASRAAERIVALASLARAVGGSSDDPFRRLGAPSIAASEVSAALKLSARTAKAMVAEALELSRPAWRPLLDAMYAGLLPHRRARTILDAAAPVPHERLGAFVAEAVSVAAPVGPEGGPDSDRIPSPATLGRRLRRMAEKHAAEPLALRKAKAREHRRVDIEAAGDAMCWLTAYLPLEDAAAVDTRLESIAHSLQGASEARTLPQLRADVFTDLLAGSDQPEGSSAGPRAEIIAIIPASTLDGSGEGAGEILGYGPLDPEAARLLAARAPSWTRLWVDERTGAPLALGRTRYRPSAAMRRQLGARDRVCRFPGCDRPATATEADHTTAWASGGETNPENLALLCREHHRLKSEGYWKARQIGRPAAHPDMAHRSTAEPPPGPRPTAPPGTIEWTSPTGRRHVTYPEGDPPPPF